MSTLARRAAVPIAFGLVCVAGMALIGVQGGVFVLLLVGLLYAYWEFKGPFCRFAVRHLGLTALLVLVYLLLYGLVGTGFGIPYLFWHEDFRPRVGAAMGVTLLLGVLGMIAYYLDPFPRATERRTSQWLRADEQLKAMVQRWWRREPAARADGPGVSAPQRVVFAYNAILSDPISLTPLQRWLEPEWPNPVRLQRFLRTCRTPFLLLVLAPALLPEFFVNVPHSAPTGPGLAAGLSELDVRSPWGYLLGLAAWLLGIWAGVLLIKLLVRASELRYAMLRLVLWAGTRMEWLPPERQERLRRVLATSDPSDGRHPNCQVEGCPGAGCPLGEPAYGCHPPSGCRGLREFSLSVWLFFVLFIAAYVGLGASSVLQEWVVSPAFAICSLLAVLAMVYAGFSFMPRIVTSVLARVADRLTTAVEGRAADGGAAPRLKAAAGRLGRIVKSVEEAPKLVQVPTVVLLVLWLGLVNNDPFRNRYESLPYDEASLVDLRYRADDSYFSEAEIPARAGPPGLVSDSQALEGWARVHGAGGSPSGPKPKLVLVAVSGGAARSAYWTAVVLDRLERELPREFGRSVRVIAGASGGMLGAACYVNYRRDVATGRATEPRHPGDKGSTRWIDRVPSNSMVPLAKYIALNELWHALVPWRSVEDRGTVLEKDWEDAKGAGLGFPLSDLADLERDGRIPSLIFSPMLVDDGRRLLISNLDLFRGPEGPMPTMIRTSSGQIDYRYNDEIPDGTGIRPASLTGLEYYRLFSTGAGLHVSTAVRMSASFPYVSPAVNLPTRPFRRVVDAGYWDNYGIRVATSWLRKNYPWLVEHTSGILLVQIRDSSSVLDRLDFKDAGGSRWESMKRGFQFLTSPIDAFLSARYTVSSFRNDADVEAVHEQFSRAVEGKVEHPESFFTTAIFENSSQVSQQAVDFWGDLDLRASDAGLELSGSRVPPRPGVAVVQDPNPSEVAMTWYLTRREKAAIERGLPPEPPEDSPWRNAANRTTLQDEALKPQVFGPDDPEEWEPLPEARKRVLRERLRREWERLGDEDIRARARRGEMAYPPGQERDLALKRLEQLRNYERVQNLKRWWTTSGKPVAPGADAALTQR
jgi:hypothetical protein